LPEGPAYRPGVRKLDLMTGDGKLPAVHDRTGHGRSMLLNLPGGPDPAIASPGTETTRLAG